MTVKEMIAELAKHDADREVAISSGIIGNDWGVGELIVDEKGRVLILPQPVFAGENAPQEEKS